jgi:uncharacterized protein (AIM24 family)
MSKYSLTEFVRQTAQKDDARERFQLENPHLLEINLNGQVWAKTGAMIGYVGRVKFKREGMLDRGLGGLLKKAVTGEGMSLMSVNGVGRVYFADKGKKVRVLYLEGETISVNGNDVLVLEDGLDYDITLLKSFGAMAAGGLFNVRIEGTGHVAITTHYEPITLQVLPGHPVFTDPNATVAWSGNLTPTIHTDVSLGTFLGRGSGESFQLRFEAGGGKPGWVVLQPYEETPVVHAAG